MSSGNKKLPVAVQKVLAECVDKGWPARIAIGLIYEKTGLKLSLRTVCRRMSELHPDAEVRRILTIFVDVVVEKIRSLQTRRPVVGEKQ
jgi:hypothetical protein